MPRAPREESSDSTHFSVKRQRDRKSQLSNSMRARIGPQEPARSRPPVATTWAPRPDPMVTPMQVGRNLPNEPPIGSISKRLDDMLSTPSALTSSITSPQGDSRTKIFYIQWIQRSLRSYHALSTTDDARLATTHYCAKYFPPAYKGRPSHGFIAYLPTLLAISGTCPKLSWDNTCAPHDTSRTSTLCKT
ncbi:hypothetical protein CK203_029621 [Vitis vinifera]|uniref:Uncharacterized protein n=1 Tax=Vitis vinifera TaxID=29760 RepID=A0A438IIB4_VITVI|nr:hypothetical protein CK203_029621 [Vitis vinifera]